MRPFEFITRFIFIEDKPQKSDVILVPGGMRTQLIERAVELYQKGLAEYILPSGGVGPKLAKKIEEGSTTWQSEWAYLQNIALKHSVPSEAILKEDKAKHTFENAEFSYKVLRNNNIEVKKVILVCKAHHALRALLTYRTIFPLNIEFYVSPIIDDRDVRPDNWFLDQKKVDLVLSEVEKIGQYFGKHLHKWTG